MQPASEKCSYVEELSCKEDSLKENQFCFNQNQDSLSEWSWYGWCYPDPIMLFKRSVQHAENKLVL